MVCVVAALLLVVFVRRWRSAQLDPDGTRPVAYQGPVRAWVRRPTRSRPRYAYLKGGVGPLVLTVREDTISLRHSVFARRFAAMFGLDYTISTRGLTTEPFDESMSYGRRAVVIHGRDKVGPLDLAILPIEGDLERVRTAIKSCSTS
jgi:hypothetical protein